MNETLINETLQSLQSYVSDLQQRFETLQGPTSGSVGADESGALAASLDMGRYERAFWVLLFSLMVLVAAGGNMMVVWIVWTNKEMKSVTNYFLVNLSLADTMVSTLNVIFNFISMLQSHWPFGEIYCKISNFIAILSISASVFTLTAISCDRYNAILHPLRPRMSHSKALTWIFLIWTLSSSLALPEAIFSALVVEHWNPDPTITCTMIWPDGRYPSSSQDHVYNIILLVVTYVVPISTMAILYYRVGKELWGSEAIGENVDKQQRALLAKKKIVKMMIVVVIIFALCWFPYHAFFVFNFYAPNIFQDAQLLYQRCYLLIYWAAMSNSMYNPIIIYFMNSNFRKEFRKILCLVFCCRAKLSTGPLSSSNSVSYNYSTRAHHHQQRPQTHSSRHHLTASSLTNLTNKDRNNLSPLPMANGSGAGAIGSSSTINTGAIHRLHIEGRQQLLEQNSKAAHSHGPLTVTISVPPSDNSFHRKSHSSTVAETEPFIGQQHYASDSTCSRSTCVDFASSGASAQFHKMSPDSLASAPEPKSLI